MATSDVPVNRTLVGALSLVCAALGGLTWAISDPSGANLWPGAFLRVSVVLGAFWLALPTRYREAAWARVPIWHVAGVVIVGVVICTRVPLRLLIPAGIALCIALLILRPRSKKRPPR